MGLISKSFTALENGGAISVQNKGVLNYSVSGTFSGTVVLQKSTNGGLTWESVLSATASTSGSIFVENMGGNQASFRFVCTVFSSGTIVTSLYDVSANVKKVIISGAEGGVSSGLASGWVSPNYGYASLPAGETDSELIVPVSGLKVGTQLVGYYLQGRFESAGNAVSLVSIPSLVSPTASSVNDNSLPGTSTITISGTADTLLSQANSYGNINYTLKDGDNPYFYFTGTTAASTGIFLTGIVLLVLEL
jgi:hypothetical protein